MMNERAPEGSGARHVAAATLWTLGAIGAPGFEPGTSCSQSRRATGLRHTPSAAQNYPREGGEHSPGISAGAPASSRSGRSLLRARRPRVGESWQVRLRTVA